MNYVNKLKIGHSDMCAISIFYRSVDGEYGIVQPPCSGSPICDYNYAENLYEKAHHKKSAMKLVGAKLGNPNGRNFSIYRDVYDTINFDCYNEKGDDYGFSMNEDFARALGLALVVIGTSQKSEELFGPLFGKNGPYLDRIWDELFDDSNIPDKIKWMFKKK